MAKRVIHGFFVSPSPSGELSVGVAWTEHGWQPHVDIYESAEAFFISVDVAGVPDENLRIQFLTEPRAMLLLEGKRERPNLPQGMRCLQVELEHGAFRREIRLPQDVDGAAISATRQNGLLVISVPRRQPQAPISVKVAVG